MSDVVVGISMYENALNLKYYEYAGIINSYSDKGNEMI